MKQLLQGTSTTAFCLPEEPQSNARVIIRDLWHHCMDTSTPCIVSLVLVAACALAIHRRRKNKSLLLRSVVAMLTHTTLFHLATFRDTSAILWKFSLPSVLCDWMLLLLNLAVIATFLGYSLHVFHSDLFRWFVAIPGQWFLIVNLLYFPVWLGCVILALRSTAVLASSLLVACVLASLVMAQNLSSPRWEELELPLAHPVQLPTSIVRAPVSRKRLNCTRLPLVADKLSVVQISDPHVGLFQSAQSLRTLCEEAVALCPDLVVLTGDLIAAEVMRDTAGRIERLLSDALQPLQAMRGRSFACLGNHDYEGLPIVRRCLDAAGVCLLGDTSAEVTVPHFGPVRVTGLHYVFGRQQTKERHVRRVFARLHELATAPTRLHLVLMHDPAGFAAIPADEDVVVLAGHVHGGQIGLLSLGIPFTLAEAVLGLPAHGAYRHGRNTLFVHRGHGQHAIPFRLGVAREKCVLVLSHVPTTTGQQ